MIRFEVVSDSSVSTVNRKVCELLERGYDLQGELKVNVVGGRLYYTQVVVKECPDTEDSDVTET
jgi:hypothetical protein